MIAGMLHSRKVWAAGLYFEKNIAETGRWIKDWFPSSSSGSPDCRVQQPKWRLVILLQRID
jgi:hypothetical protein